MRLRKQGAQEATPPSFTALTPKQLQDLDGAVEAQRKQKGRAQKGSGRVQNSHCGLPGWETSAAVITTGLMSKTYCAPTKYWARYYIQTFPALFFFSSPTTLWGRPIHFRIKETKAQRDSHLCKMSARVTVRVWTITLYCFLYCYSTLPLCSSLRIFKFQYVSESPGSFDKTHSPGPIPRDSDSTGPEWAFAVLTSSQVRAGAHTEKQNQGQTYTCQILTITVQEVENQIKKVKNSQENQRILRDVNFSSME